VRLRRDSPGRHVLPSCGDPECYWWHHKIAGWFMRRRPYPWEDLK
jgi:hypothetical protein